MLYTRQKIDCLQLLKVANKIEIKYSSQEVKFSHFRVAPLVSGILS